MLAALCKDIFRSIGNFEREAVKKYSLNDGIVMTKIENSTRRKVFNDKITKIYALLKLG